jgi:AbrB family looped-hinge helix DNA binding protein
MPLIREKQTHNAQKSRILTSYSYFGVDMRVTDKGQVTIPQEIRQQAGILPGSEVVFSFEAGRVVVSKVPDAANERKKRLQSLAVKARASMSSKFRKMNANEIMEFIRGD